MSTSRDRSSSTLSILYHCCQFCGPVLWHHVGITCAASCTGLFCPCLVNYIHAHVHTYPACLHTCTHTSMHIHMHVCIHTCIHTQAGILTGTHSYIHPRIHINLRPYMHAHMHTYIHTYIHTFVHTYSNSEMHVSMHRDLRSLADVCKCFHCIHTSARLPLQRLRALLTGDPAPL